MRRSNLPIGTGRLLRSVRNTCTARKCRCDMLYIINELTALILCLMGDALITFFVDKSF